MQLPGPRKFMQILCQEKKLLSQQSVTRNGKWRELGNVKFFDKELIDDERLFSKTLKPALSHFAWGEQRFDAFARVTSLDTGHFD